METFRGIVWKPGLAAYWTALGGAVTTSAGTYDVDAGKSLRNFTTHGGTTPDKQGRDMLDGELTRKLINLLGDELTG
jgi:hypothetical protein